MGESCAWVPDWRGERYLHHQICVYFCICENERRVKSEEVGGVRV